MNAERFKPCRSCRDQTPVDEHGYCIHCREVLRVHGIQPYGPVAPKPPSGSRTLGPAVYNDAEGLDLAKRTIRLSAGTTITYVQMDGGKKIPLAEPFPVEVTGYYVVEIDDPATIIPRHY